jgi:hypothetical protein
VAKSQIGQRRIRDLRSRVLREERVTFCAICFEKAHDKEVFVGDCFGPTRLALSGKMWGCRLLPAARFQP